MTSTVDTSLNNHQPQQRNEQVNIALHDSINASNTTSAISRQLCQINQVMDGAECDPRMAPLATPEPITEEGFNLFMSKKTYKENKKNEKASEIRRSYSAAVAQAPRLPTYPKTRPEIGKPTPAPQQISQANTAVKIFVGGLHPDVKVAAHLTMRLD
jgi:hypothetical protein